MLDTPPVKGHIHWELVGENGEVKVSGDVDNLVTQFGNQYYAERAAGVAGAPAAVTGMQLGTGTTAAATTGAGAAVGTLVAGSLVALNPAVPTSSAGGGTSRRLTYTASWPAGTATATGIAEVVLTNQATATQTAAPAGATVSRALFVPTVNKGAADTLTVTWTHDLGA